MMLSDHDNPYLKRLCEHLGVRVDIDSIEAALQSRAEISNARVFCLESLESLESSDVPYLIATVVLSTPLKKHQKRQLSEQLITLFMEELPGCLLPRLVVATDSLGQNKGKPPSLSLDSRSDNLYFLEALERRRLSELRGFPLLHSLPLDKPRQARHRPSLASLHQALDSGRADGLRQFCNRQGVELWPCLNALFALFALRFSSSSKLLTATRLRLEERGRQIVGPNHIQAWNLNQNETLSEFVRKAKDTLSLSVAYPSLTNTLSNRLSRGLEPGYHPIYQLHLDYLEGEQTGAALAADAPFLYDIQLVVHNLGDEIRLSWRYDANLFSYASVHRMASALLTLFDQVVTQQDKPLHTLALVSPQEYKTRIAANPFNDFPNDVTVSQLFERHAASDPGRIAVIGRGESFTYGELSRRSRLLATQLRDVGIEPGTCVGVLVKRSPLLMIAILALTKLRAVYVPLDPQYPLERLQYMTQDSGLDIVLTQLETEGLYSRLGAKLVVLDAEPSAFPEGQAPTFVDEGGRGDDPAYIVYTSGSTGRPKGVVGTVQSLANRLNWMDKTYPVEPGERFVIKTSISFIDHLTEALQPLISGATMVILPETATANPLTFIDAIDEYQITRITLVPSQLEKLLKAATGESLWGLRVVMSSGEPLFESLARQFHRHLGGRAKLLNLYGSTETGADLTCHEVPYDEYRAVWEYFEEVDETELSTHNFAEDILHRPLRMQSFTAPDMPLEDLSKKFQNTNMPEQRSELSEYLTYLKEDVLPYMVNVSSSKFIGHMTAALPNYIPLFSQIISKYNQNVVKVETSKVMTLVERQVLATMHRLFFNFPESHYETTVQNPDYMHGIITSGGSLANISALYCARNSGLIKLGASKSELSAVGSTRIMSRLGFNRAVILVSRLAHYSVKKAAALLGMGENDLIFVDQDENFRVRGDLMEKKIRECREDGAFIIAIIGIAGATETGTIDPLNDLAHLAEKHNIHFHVDAAWGGAFLFSDKYRHKFSGIERADSITFCAHKQLYLAQGVSLCLFRDAKSLFSISTHADYQSERGSFDLGQFTLEGSRPANSLLLHASLHLLGKTGYAWIVEQSMEKTAFFRQILEQSECFELIGDSDLNVINYRYIPAELRRPSQQYTTDENQHISRVTELIQKTQFLKGHTFVSRTRIVYPAQTEHKITVFRVVLSNLRTEYEDLIETLIDQLTIANEMSETADVPGSMLPDAQQLSAPRKYKPICPIGKPIDGTTVYILDEYLNPVPIGVVGELYVGGHCLAKGYTNTELTKSKWISNPHNIDGRDPILFKTGDLGRLLQSGDIEFCGRNDQQVKLNGYRIELAEIESVLRGLDGVEKAVVMIKENLSQESALIAYIAFDHHIYDKPSTIDRVKSALVGKLPTHMIPSHVHLMDRIPLNVNGKVDLNLLSAGMVP